MAGEYDAAVQAGAQVASAGIEYASAANANKKQRQWMEDQANTNWARQNEMWQKTNDFNLMVSDPAFQMQRLLKAGVNPFMAFGKGAQDVKASNMNASMPGNYNHQRGDSSRIANAMQNYIGTKMAQKQMQNIDAQTHASMATAANQQALAEYSRFNLEKDKQLLPGVVIAQGLTNTGTDLENQNKIKTGNILTANVEKINSEIAQIGANIGRTEQEIKNLQQKFSMGIVEIKNLIKEGEYKDAQIKAIKIGNMVIEATATGKIEAENAKNELIRSTRGMSEKGMFNLPSVLTGQIMESIDQVGKRRGWWIPRKP